MIGRTISHYRITGKIGGGGMGVVYKAEDTRLKRTVALKFLPPELTRDRDAKTRFIHEAQAASALQHHNICTIHEIDETPDGQLFISMDRYEGETLKQLIARGPLPLEDAIDITSQIASGLAKAHAAGVVHRDIKPANIIVTDDGMVKILDFGLAKLAGQTRVTKTGTTLGTIAYMSPEQAGGEDVDARSDIFSLGAIFYELLTGSAPFKGEQEAAVLYNIMNSAPEKLTALRSDLPRQLQPILNRMLAKERTARYQSCEAVLADIMTLKVALVSAAGPRVPRRRNPLLRAAAAVAAVIVVVAVVAFIAGKRRTPPPSPDTLSLAVIDFSTVAEIEDRVLSAGITNLLHVGLVEDSPIRVIPTSYLKDLRRRLFRKTTGSIAESEALEIARRADAALLLTGQVGELEDEEYVIWVLLDVQTGEIVTERRVDALRTTDLVDQILAEAVPAIARHTGTAPPDEPSAVSTMTTGSQEAFRHYTAGVLALDEQRLEDAQRHFEAAIKADSLFALAYYKLSCTYTRESGPGRTYAEKAWKLRDRLGTKDRMRLQAWMAWIDYRVTDALAIDRELVARWPEDRELLKDLAQKLFANWYKVEAGEILSRGIRLYPDDYYFGSAYELNLANVRGTTRALEAARKLVKKHPRNPDAWDCLGYIFQTLGKPDSAETMFKKALAIDPAFIWSQRNLAYNEYYKGNSAAAEKRINEVLARDDLLAYTRLALMTDMLQTPSLAFLSAERGRFEQSLQIIDEAERFAPDPERKFRFIYPPRNEMLLRTGRAADVLAWAQTAARRTDIRNAKLKALEFRIYALVALDSLDAARRAVATLRSQESEWGGYAPVVALKTTAEIALREGDARAALEALDGMMAHGVPFGSLFDIEYREMRARAFRLAGRLKDAAEVHQEMLRLYGGHALSHFDLGRIYEEMGRKKDAAREYEAFLTAWADADADLPRIKEARTRLAALRAGS